MLQLHPEVERFAQHLRRLRRPAGNLRYSERTARAYALVMNAAVRHADLLFPLRVADTTAKWLLARNAALAWADWTNSPGMRQNVGTFPDPCQGTQEVKPPTDEEWGRILVAVDALPEPGKSILTILLTSGLRFTDVMGITRSNAQLVQTNREVDIRQKGGRPRQWAPGSDTRTALRCLLDLPGWTKIRDLIEPPAEAAGRLNSQIDQAAYYKLRRTLAEACHTADVPFVRFHRFRHAVSEAARRRDLPPAERQRLLGHTDYRTTDRYYTHASAERQVEVVDDIITSIRKGGQR